MEYTIPTYYRQFQCLADACPDTCCAGWEIVIDQKTRQLYEQYPGEFGNRLRHSINWNEGIFKQNAARCAFLNEKNLCDIYAEAGREMLCRTCRRYPRHYEEFENLREISLSVSCPEVARMLLAWKEPVTFETTQQEREEESYEEFDFFLFTKLQDTRELMFEIAKHRSYPLYLRMALIVTLAHDLQKRIREEKLFEVDGLLERYRALLRNKSALHLQEQFLVRYKELTGKEDRNTGKSRTANQLTQQEKCVNARQKMYQSLYRLEVLQKGWKTELKKWEKTLFYQGAGCYLDKMNRYRKENADWEIQGEQLLVYFLFTYFCGAVYDEDAFGKAKSAVVHTLLLENIFAADRMLKDGNYDRKYQERCLYRYAREVEHSQRNLNRMEEYMQHDQIFSMQKLLAVLLWKI